MKEERDQNPGPMPQSSPTLLLWKRDIMDISGKSTSRQRIQMEICLRIASVVDEVGYGHYPTDWIYLKPEYEKQF